MIFCFSIKILLLITFFHYCHHIIIPITMITMIISYKMSDYFISSKRTTHKLHGAVWEEWSDLWWEKKSICRHLTFLSIDSIWDHSHHLKASWREYFTEAQHQKTKIVWYETTMTRMYETQRQNSNSHKPGPNAKVDPLLLRCVLFCYYVHPVPPYVPQTVCGCLGW